MLDVYTIGCPADEGLRLTPIAATRYRHSMARAARLMKQPRTRRRPGSTVPPFTRVLTPRRDPARAAGVQRRLATARYGSALALLLAAGCWESDNATFQRAWRAERNARIAGMRIATAQSARGADVVGEDLRRLVAGRTHESVFERTPSGERRRYVERSYFAPDGRFIYTNSLWARDPGGREGAHWRVDGARMCILNPAMTSTEQCYTIAVRPDGRVQYFIDAPGEETHGLLTKIPTAVHEGQLPPP